MSYFPIHSKNECDETDARLLKSGRKGFHHSTTGNNSVFCARRVARAAALAALGWGEQASAFNIVKTLREEAKRLEAEKQRAKNVFGGLLDVFPFGFKQVEPETHYWNRDGTCYAHALASAFQMHPRVKTWLANNISLTNNSYTDNAPRHYAFLHRFFVLLRVSDAEFYGFKNYIGENLMSWMKYLYLNAAGGTEVADIGENLMSWMLYFHLNAKGTQVAGGDVPSMISHAIRAADSGLSGKDYLQHEIMQNYRPEIFADASTPMSSTLVFTYEDMNKFFSFLFVGKKEALVQTNRRPSIPADIKQHLPPCGQKEQQSEFRGVLFRDHHWVAPKCWRTNNQGTILLKIHDQKQVRKDEKLFDEEYAWSEKMMYYNPLQNICFEFFKTN